MAWIGGWDCSHMRQDKPGFPSLHTSLGSNWLPFLLAFTAAIEYDDRLSGQLLSFAAARALCQYLQTGLPSFLLPEQRASNHRRNLLFEHPPEAPPRAQALLIQPPPALSQLAAHAPLK